MSTDDDTDFTGEYTKIVLQKREGVLMIRFHTDGGPAIWDRLMHEEVSQLFATISRDESIRAMIITGTGDSFIDKEALPGMDALPAPRWANIHRDGTNILMDILRVECPVIAAVNGPVTLHSEIAVVADVVLASENAVFADAVHFAKGAVPGDGVHVVWPLLIGLNRARYFLLTGQRLSAREALALGVISEICSPEELLPRAWELALSFARKPDMTIRFTKGALLQPLRRALLDDLPYGLALEGLAATEFWPHS